MRKVLIRGYRQLFRPVNTRLTDILDVICNEKFKKQTVQEISMAALNSKVRKAVIPVAGLGTRMLPATKAIQRNAAAGR